MTSIKSIAVFCGWRTGSNPVYMATAKRFGEVLAREKIHLVYGGGKGGMMGAVAKAMDDNGHKVTGVILKREQNNLSETYGDTVVVETLQERKAAMFNRADAFIALPGGFGTMDELMDVIDTYQLEVHNKPIGILNVNNYYDKILEWIKFSMVEGFMSSSATDILIAESDPVTLVDKMKARVSS